MTWSILLVAMVACTVGETPPPGPSAPPAGERPSVPSEPGAGPDETPAAEAAAALLREAEASYAAAELEAALSQARRVLSQYASTPAVEPARWVAARAAFGLGRYREAGELAEAYAATRPSGSEEARAARELAALAADAVEGADAPAVIGAVLPRTGSRVLVRYGDMLLEGMELAVAEAERLQGRAVELVVADDAGGARTAEAVSELERQGAIAIVGPLLPEQVAAAASARTDSRLVLVSPTAPALPSYRSELYSLSVGDARGAEALGRYAAELDLPKAAILYLSTPEYRQKADAFASAFEAAGRPVPLRVAYDSGTTTFAEHMERILAAVGTPAAAGGPLAGRPDPRADGGQGGGPGGPVGNPFALFVAAPERDVPQIAPQVSFYGLDSAGVQVLGDASWASAGVRRRVPARDLEGVIAASYFPSDRGEDVSDPDFVRLYERTYRRSLTNPLPALGYDAAHLVLQALPARRLTPAALAQRFELLAGIRGATGLLSVRSDRIIRTPYLVMIHEGKLVPAPSPWSYQRPVAKPPTPDSAREGS